MFKKGYKIDNGKLIQGSFISVPGDFTAYTPGNEPQELLDILDTIGAENVAAKLINDQKVAVEASISGMTIKLPDVTHGVLHQEVLEVLDADGVTVITPYTVAWTETVIDEIGKEFDAHLEARINMMNAVMSSEYAGVTTTVWRLANNTDAVVSLEELKLASLLALQKFGTLKGITNA